VAGTAAETSGTWEPAAAVTYAAAGTSVAAVTSAAAVDYTCPRKGKVSLACSQDNTCPYLFTCLESKLAYYLTNTHQMFKTAKIYFQTFLAAFKHNL